MFYITMDDPTGQTLPSATVNRVFQSNQGWTTSMYDFDVLDPSLKLEKGKTGSLEFTLMPTHPFYNSKTHPIQRLKSIFRVYQIPKNADGTFGNWIELFKGRVTEITIDMDCKKTIVCEGDLGYLKDSLQPPRNAGEKDKITPKAYFAEVIKNHINGDTGGIYINKNKWNGREKEFVIGENELPTDVKHTFKNTSYQTTESVVESLISSYGGFVRTKHKAFSYQNGGYREIRQIDFICTQQSTLAGVIPADEKRIQYGVNLISLEVEYTSEGYFNTLVATGDSKSGSGASALPITISSDQHKSPVLTIGEILGKDHNAIGRFTRVVKTENFSGVKNATELYEKAKDYLYRNYVEDPQTYTVTAIDLIELDQETIDPTGKIQRPKSPIQIGDMVYLMSKPHGINGIYKECTAIQYDLTDPAKTEFTLGEELQNFSDQFKDEKKSSSGGGGTVKKTSEQGNDLQQELKEKTTPQSMLQTVIGNVTGVDIKTNPDGSLDLIGTIQGVTGNLFSKENIGSTVTSFFGDKVSKWVDTANGVFNIVGMVGDNVKEYITGEAGKELLKDYVSKKNDLGIGTSTAPTLYPSVEYDASTKRVTIGRTWGTELQGFNIADTSAYRAMIVSAESIEAARTSVEGTDSPDFRNVKDDKVYLPVTVQVQQDGKTISVNRNIEIQASTYTPSIAYTVDPIDPTKKKLFARTVTAAQMKPLGEVEIPEEVYTPDLEVLSGKVHAKTYFELADGTKQPLSDQSISVVPTGWNIVKSLIDRTGGGDGVKSFELGYNQNGSASSVTLPIPTNWITPELNVNVTDVNQRTKRVKASGIIRDGNVVLFTGESTAVDIDIGQQENSVKVTGARYYGSAATPIKADGEHNEIQIAVRVTPESLNDTQCYVGVPSSIYTVHSKNSSNVIKLKELGGNYRYGFEANAVTTAYAGYGSVQKELTIPIDTSVLATAEIPSTNCLVWHKSYPKQLKKVGGSWALPFTINGKVKANGVTKTISRDYNYTVPWWLLRIKASSYNVNGKNVNYFYNSSSHTYTVETYIQDGNNVFIYKELDVKTGTEAYEQGVKEGQEAGQNTAVRITSPPKRVSTYTNDPDHSKATILDSTYFYSKSTGTYEFAIGGKWFYINIGNNPRTHGGGTNIPVEKGITQE